MERLPSSSDLQIATEFVLLRKKVTIYSENMIGTTGFIIIQKSPLPNVACSVPTCTLPVLDVG